ncbi:MAG TPA: hypothetical protein VHG51_04355 [Longimicrobiaceae bacterium]|nr:hypothetical protein [Longimicrobiaceae bacterium]
MTRSRNIRRIVFAAAVLGSLGFGASQALAGPIWPTDPTPTWCPGPDCAVRNNQCICW